MKCICRHAIASYFRVNARATSFGKFKFFEYQNSGALTNNKPIAVALKGARCMLRIVIARRKRPHRREARHTHGRDGRLGATTNHYVSISALDYLEAVADGVRAGRASSGGG